LTRPTIFSTRGAWNRCAAKNHGENHADRGRRCLSVIDRPDTILSRRPSSLPMAMMSFHQSTGFERFYDHARSDAGLASARASLLRLIAPGRKPYETIQAIWGADSLAGPLYQENAGPQLHADSSNSRMRTHFGARVSARRSILFGFFWRMTARHRPGLAGPISMSAGSAVFSCRSRLRLLRALSPSCSAPGVYGRDYRDAGRSDRCRGLLEAAALSLSNTV